MSKLTVSDVLKATHSPTKRYIIQKAYDLFYKNINKKLITCSTQLPYPTNVDENFFAVHVQIESESCRGFWYDVVIQFLDDTIRPSTKIRIYNNTPAFVYFLAYVYHKLDALIFTHLFPVQVFTIPPKNRNPKQLPDPDKYTYAAIKFAQGLRINKNYIEKHPQKTEWKYIKSVSETERLRHIKCK